MSVTIVWDYDYSLIDVNSDTWLPKELSPEGDYEEMIRTGWYSGVPWTELMGQVTEKLCKEGIGKETFLKAIARLPISPEVEKVIEEAHGFGVKQHIVSDANTVYIGDFLKTKGYSEFFTSIHTNKAYWGGEDGNQLFIKPFQSKNDPHGCTMCPANLCKGKVIDDLKIVNASNPLPSRNRVIYIGDGGGDTCAALRLQEGDVVLARTDCKLLKDLSSKYSSRVKAKVVPWSSGETIRYIILNSLVEMGIAPTSVI